MVSVITTGLVQYLDLVKEDNSNLKKGGTDVVGVSGKSVPTAILQVKIVMGDA
jgi:hypothetical protein